MADTFTPGRPEEPPPDADRTCRHWAVEPDPDSTMPGRGVCRKGSAKTSSKSCWEKPTAACPIGKREEYTDAERGAWEAYMRRCVARDTAIIDCIPAEGESGTFPCPGCGPDIPATVTWFREPEHQHLRAYCSTEGCLVMIQ